MVKFRAVQGGERMGDSPLMSSVLRLCRKCGAKIFADAPEGLCTVCLFETGLDLFALEAVAGFGLSAEAAAKADYTAPDGRSEERRVGKECRSGGERMA